MSTAHREHQRTYYDRTYPRREAALRDQLAHPLFCSFQDRLARRVLDAVGAGAGTTGTSAAAGTNGQGPGTLRIFETACGEGLLGSAILREAARRGIHVHYAGADLSEGAVGLARATLGDDLVVGDAVEVTAGMPAGSADVIVIKNLLHHLEDPAALLREAGRVVGPPGHVVVIEAHLGCPHFVFLAVTAPRREKFYFLGTRRNRKAVKRAGLTIQHAERFSFLPYELFFHIRFSIMRRLFSTSNPRTIERISDLDDRLAARLPRLSSYWLWVAAPTVSGEGRRSST